jgi:hypothetical protein
MHVVVAVEDHLIDLILGEDERQQQQKQQQHWYHAAGLTAGCSSLDDVR